MGVGYREEPVGVRGSGLPTFIAADGMRIYNFWNCHSSMQRIVDLKLG